MTCGERLIDPTTGKALRDPATGKVLRNPCGGQICVQSLLFSGIGAVCSSGGYVTSGMNLTYPVFIPVPIGLPNFYPLQGLALQCSSPAPAPFTMGASSASTSPQLAFYPGGVGYNALYPTTSDSHGGFTPGTFNSSYGPASTVTIEYPTTSPFPQTIPSTVTIGNGPVTSVRSPTTGLQIPVSAGTGADWTGILPLTLENLCGGLYYGYSGQNTSTNWNGTGMVSLTMAPLQPMAITVVVPTADGNATVQFAQNSYSPTGTFTAVDPLTVPQTLTVS